MDLRAYFFTNYYLSQIQRGIQSGHCIAELFLKYSKRSKNGEMLYEWAKNHKTMIVLNGGNARAISSLSLFCNNYIDLPGVVFNEDEDSLGRAITCFGIVVPQRIYDCPDPETMLSANEKHFYDAMKGCSLA